MCKTKEKGINKSRLLTSDAAIPNVNTTPVEPITQISRLMATNTVIT